jgi:hypothetical protein
MSMIISLGFDFKEEFHYVLITVRELKERMQYRLTVMNGELEKLLFDCNIVNEVNGELELDDCNGNREKWLLKKQIIEALSNYTHKKIRIQTSFQS